MNAFEKKYTTLLDKEIVRCKRCSLHKNGIVKPYYSNKIKYAIIGESPWKVEVEQNTSFIGSTGNLLWNELSRYQLYREDFLILNSVNCSAISNHTKKATAYQVGMCHSWNLLYLKTLMPSKVLILGNLAMGSVNGDFEGITSKVGYTDKIKIPFGDHSKYIPVMFCVHPSYALFNEGIGIKQLRAGLKIFSNMEGSVYE